MSKARPCPGLTMTHAGECDRYCLATARAPETLRGQRDALAEVVRRYVANMRNGPWRGDGPPVTHPQHRLYRDAVKALGVQS